MEEQDKILLDCYMAGFNDELSESDLRLMELSLKAYKFGKMDFLSGDDVSSINLQTSEEVLEKIYK